MAERMYRVDYSMANTQTILELLRASKRLNLRSNVPSGRCPACRAILDGEILVAEQYVNGYCDCRWHELVDRRQDPDSPCKHKLETPRTMTDEFGEQSGH